MIGFLVGTVCLIGLIKVARGGCGYGYGYGGYGGSGHGGWERGGSCGSYGRGKRGWGGPPWARGGWGRGGRGGFGPQIFLRHLFERLQATPGQERVILSAFDELRSAARTAKSEAKGARVDVAKAMRGESFDEDALGGATARFETALDTFRKSSISAFAKVHGALDERQRSVLADLLEHGPSSLRDGPFGGPFDGPFGDHDHDHGHPYRTSV